MEEKNAMQALFDRAAPPAKRFLEDPALMERLKKSSPWLGEEELRENLKDILSQGGEEAE